MTPAELKQAMIDEIPVTHNGIDYKRVTGIIYRKRGNAAIIQAELLDKNGRSFTYAAPKKVSRLKK
ncbi:MAG: hypothetical protein U0I48_02550 [Acutalibacteraceae bacterium]|nr:hypothetical protein [Acutalibacteraceae bacterium]